MALRSIELCAGYGGFSLGLRDHDIRTVAYVERDSYAAATLVARMEESRLDQAPIWDDLCTFDGSAWRGRVDLITAGFPCQPFSTAGLQQGVNDERWIWPDIARIIADVQPRYVFLENVTGLIRAGLGHVLTDLADLGFDAEWGVLSAAAVGAPHRRQRVWILADAAGPRRQGDRPSRSDQKYNPVTDGCVNLAYAESARCESPKSEIGDQKGVAGPQRCCFPPSPNDRAGWEAWTASGGPQPAVRRGPNGRPAGLADALHLGGNGLVPQVAAEAFRQLRNRHTTT
jgi:DNA (cytosine-5)-methyltransferase 1